MAISLADGLVGLDAPSQSPTAMVPFDNYLSEQLGLPATAVYSIRVGNIGRLRKQVQQSDRGVQATIVAAVYRDESLIDKSERVAGKILGLDHKDALVAVYIPEGTAQPSKWVVFEPVDGTVTAALSLNPNHLNVQHVPTTPESAETEEDEQTLPFTVPVLDEGGLLIVDPRIRRMLRLAIASSKAVMLIGPPGTGKTTLLAEALAEARANPAGYGLKTAPAEPLQVTPEEGWTTRELIGGESIDDEGRLRFKTGHVLDAIRRNRWLILDEANRADMDRIFGGLLTFLSGKPVSLGRASGGLDGAELVLTWDAEDKCSVDGLERLEDGTGEDIVFKAGADWRLLGTYNALDAHRVFRFGQALGRRFARVPVPAITVEAFVEALQPRLERLLEAHDEVDIARVERVASGLYAAHRDLPTPIGPALFLAIPSYLASGLSAPSEQDEVPGELLDRLIPEAYLLGAGPLLAQLDGVALEGFHRHVVTDEELLSEEQWAFIASLLPALS